MASKPISITLPEAMLEEVERAAKTEHRTRSELIREALRHYLSLRGVPPVEATSAELAAIKHGEKEIARGDYVTIKELDNDLGVTHRQKRATKHQKASSQGSRTPLRRT